MAEAPQQPSGTPPPAGSPGAGGDTPPAGTPGTPPPAASSDLDLSKLTADQLTKVLENPELFKLPRIQELLESQKALKKLQDDQAKASDESLVAQKKFEDLATQRGDKITTLEQTIQTMNINQALTNLLVKESVVDLDGALKLIDRSKITVGDDGQVTGVDDALASLKTDKGYLFSGTPGQPSVGNPSNPQATPPAGGMKFKESQLTPEFYQANKAAIDEAGRQGLIEADGPPQQ